MIKSPIIWGKYSNSDFMILVSIAQMDTQSSTVSNYAGGGAVGGSWTDKIMDVKSSASSKTNDGDGADDDEWVNNCFMFL